MIIELDNEGAKRLGDRIKALRKQRQLTQEAFCERAQIARQTLFNVEHASRPTRYGTISTIAKALGVTVEELVAPLTQTVTSPVTSSAAPPTPPFVTPPPEPARPISDFVRRHAPAPLPLTAALAKPLFGEPLWAALPGTPPRWLAIALPQLSDQQRAGLRLIYAPDNSLRPLLGAGDPALVDPSDTAIPTFPAPPAVCLVAEGAGWAVRLVYALPSGQVVLGTLDPADQAPLPADQVQILARVVYLWQGRNLLAEL